jgi:hypothetical protein
MTIPILVEPAGAGYRAVAGGPFDLSADGPTAADAVATLQRRMADRVSGGAVCLEVPLPPPSSAHMLPLTENPLLDDWLKAVEEYRDEADATRGV